MATYFYYDVNRPGVKWLCARVCATYIYAVSQRLCASDVRQQIVSNGPAGLPKLKFHKGNIKGTDK